MAHYVLSDIHGFAWRFDAMLNQIHFSPADTLYVLGDVVDRGPDGVSLLRRIATAPNMEMILGNHEFMCLQATDPQATGQDWYRWSRNGCAPTLAGLKRLSRTEYQQVLDFLQGLPTQLTVQVGDTAFHLVHGFPADTVHDRVWTRPEPGWGNPILDTCLIVGHTPVIHLGRNQEETSQELARLINAGQHLKIFHGAGFWDIDCGCGYDLPCSRLACLRLEDLAEFYI